MSYLRASVRCTFVWGPGASLHRDSPLEWAQFLAKNRNKFLAQNRAAFCFFFMQSHARVLGSQWVVCWAFAHDSALSFPSMLAADDLSVYFNWNCFFFTKQKAQSDLTGSPLMRSDYRLSKSWQFMCRCVALTVFCVINKLCSWKQMHCWTKNNGHKRKCEILPFLYWKWKCTFY